METKTDLMKNFLEDVSQGKVFEFFVASLNALKFFESDLSQHFFCFLYCVSEEMNETVFLTLALLFKNRDLSTEQKISE